MALDVGFLAPPVSAAQILNVLPTLLYSVVGGLVLIFILKAMSHRIKVEKLLVVQGGHVIKSGRYKEAIDRKTNLRYLKSMFGNEKLPAYPSSCYQKIKSLPVFGLKRQLSLIFPNKYSPIVVMPTYKYESKAHIYQKNVKRYYYMLEREKFLRSIRNNALIYNLSIYAPLVIILGTLIFFIIEIYLQNGIYENLGNKIDAVSNQLIAVLGE